EVVSTFTTKHPCCKPRVTNIHRIAEIVDGALVLPGETFSLNEHVGPRDRARGFVEAPMIERGSLVDAVGGGVSQFATTMFNAVFFAGLKDIEHKPHSFYISRYPAGREATVSSPQPDLKWQNDHPTGILVKTSYTGTTITVTFYGTKQYDEIRSLSGVRTRPTKPKTVYLGPSTPEKKCNGVDVGQDGFDIVVYREFWKGGAQVKPRERFYTRYLPENVMICTVDPATLPPPVVPPVTPPPTPPPATPPPPNPSATPSPAPTG
ncbi:MAG: VanW family protein, partial [Mycobacteriales bacterium]